MNLRSPKTEGLSVLFVEDNAAVRLSVIEGLTEDGLEVTSASTADTAISLIQQQDFDVLVTDIHLDTELGGVEIAASWRSKHPDKPIVFATAYLRSDIDAGALRQNDGYLVKPFSPGELLKLIRFVLSPPAVKTQKRVEPNVKAVQFGGAASDVVDDAPWLS